MEEEDKNSSWEHARAYANLLGAVPSSFTTAIRQLKADTDKSQPLSRATAFQAARLCNSPSLSAALLAAGKTFFPEINLTAESPLVTTLPPEAISGLISTAFFYFRGRKLAAEEEWVQYSKIVPIRVELGGIIGRTIPRIGVTRGVLGATFDTIALTAFHLHDKKGFTEYRRYLKNKGKREDTAYENDRWGCNRYYVASILIQAMGFGVDFANSYATGMLAGDTEEKNLATESYCFRLLKVWLDSLESTGTEPDRSIRVEYYPQTAELTILRDRAQKLKSQPPTSSWLDKTKKDVETIDDTPS